VGVGAARGLSAVRWGVTTNIVTAWVLTFPICAAIAWTVVKIVRVLD
jgi:PiT family inorganic phosphate transporter